MSLSRELCEALQVLSEVREHKWAEGDLFWNRYGRAVPACECGSYDCDQWPDKGDPWCPSLSDLLALATEHCLGAHLSWHGGWRFFDCGDGYNQDTGEPRHLEFSDDPAEAVARWLIAQTKEASAG